MTETANVGRALHPDASEVRSLEVPVEDLAVRGRRVEGYAARYGEESRDLGGWREVLEPGAFREVLASSPDVVATFNHEPSALLGRTTSGTLKLEDRSDGLWFSVELPDSPTGSTVREAVRRGDASGASFRFVVGRHRWAGEVRHVEQVAELRDVAVVVTPAYAGPRVELRAQPDTVSGGNGAEPLSAGQGSETEGTMKVEERTTPEGGGLKVEERQASAGPSVEERILDALGSVRKGEARALTTASGSAGPVTPPELSTFLWDKLRARSIALASGVRIIRTDRSEIHWPRLTTDVAPDWYAEAETITAGDPAFDTLTAKPKKLAHRVVVSNEALDDSDPSLRDLLTTHLAAMLALKLDRDIFFGTATDGIDGLIGVAGIQSVVMGSGAGGALANLDPFADAIGLLMAANVPGPYAIAMAPRTWTTLTKVKEATGSVRPVLSGESAPTGSQAMSIYGLPVFVSSQFPVNETEGAATTATSAFVYAPNEVVLVQRTDVEIEWDRSRLFDSDQSEVRGKVRCDLIVPNPVAVVRVRGIIP